MATANQAKTDAQNALTVANANHQATIAQIEKEKNAAIAAAQASADEDVAEAQAQAQKDIDEAEAKALADVAAKQSELDTKQGELDAKQNELDTAQANLQAQVNFELPNINQNIALSLLGFESVNVLNKKTGKMVEYRVPPGDALSTKPSDGLTHDQRKQKAIDDYMAQIDPAFINDTNKAQIEKFMNDMVSFAMSREFWKKDSIFYQNKIVDIQAQAATDLANAISLGETNVAAKQAEMDAALAQAESDFNTEKQKIEQESRAAGQQDVQSYFIPSFSYDTYFKSDEYLGWGTFSKVNSDGSTSYFYDNPNNRSADEVRAIRDRYLADYREVLDAGPLSEQQKDRIVKYVQYSIDNKSSRDSYAKNAMTYAAQRDAANTEIDRITKEYDDDILKLNTNHELEVLNLRGLIDTATQDASDALAAFEAEEAKFKAKEAEYNALVLERDQIAAARKAADAQNIQLTTANEKYIADMAKQDADHATALNQAKSDYDTQLANRESELQAQYQQDLNDKETELETKYNNDLAAETTRLEQEAQDRLDAQKLELEAERDAAVTAARADEVLIASGNLAIREQQLEDKYQQDLAAANSLSAKLLSEAVADETTRMQLLADEALLKQKNELDAKYATDLRQRKLLYNKLIKQT